MIKESAHGEIESLVGNGHSFDWHFLVFHCSQRESKFSLIAYSNYWRDDFYSLATTRQFLNRAHAMGRTGFQGLFYGDFMQI